MDSAEKRASEQKLKESEGWEGAAQVEDTNDCTWAWRWEGHVCSGNEAYD